ncbi:hypothetical protein IFR05_014090 [Cadophora sp. M221]|nr:hypothetical protein IFR05_014090 [Cadophora sp. M221]
MEKVPEVQKEERREFEPVSKQQAEEDVTSLISGWFSNNYSDDDTYRPRSNYSESSDSNIKPLTPVIQESYHSTSSYPPPSSSQPSPYTRTLVGSTSPVYPDRTSTNSTRSSPPTSSTPPPLVQVVEDWDWRCDGCDKKFYYHDLRFKCQDCSDFDFCPQCFPNVWHQHPTSSFVERSV